MTKEELTEIIKQAYWQGFKDAGKLIVDTSENRKSTDGYHPNKPNE